MLREQLAPYRREELFPKTWIMEAEDSELDIDLIVARELINRGYNLEIHSPILRRRIS